MKTLPVDNISSGDYKDSKQVTQLNTIFTYLQSHTATASMVTEATGIAQKCITRYKRDLELSGRLKEVTHDYCKHTGHKAHYLTTNPTLFPKDGQLRMFEGGQNA